MAAKRRRRKTSRRKSRRRRGGRRRRGFKGLGQLKGSARIAVPIVAASGVTAATTLGLRAYLQPQPGATSEKLYRWAPAIGAGAGLLAAGAGYYLGGANKTSRTSAMLGAYTAIAAGGVLLLSERLTAATPGGMSAVGGGVSAEPSGGEGTAGMGALLPEYAPEHYGLGRGQNGLGAIVMEPLKGAYGEEVNVAGLGASYNQSAFGQSPY